MSSTRCELVNWLLVPLFSIVVCLCFLNLGVLEFYILTGYCVFTLVSHILFGICVVSIGQSMLNHISRDDSKRVLKSTLLYLIFWQQQIEPFYIHPMIKTFMFNHIIIKPILYK